MLFSKLDFSTAPFLVIWETTQACPLACQHCRACAIETRDPAELTTEEGMTLLSQVAEMGTPVCVLSGGDPLRRPDLAALVRKGTELGIRMATIPAASPELTREKLSALAEAGLAQVAFSLDGSSAEVHDGFRGVPGTFDKTMQALSWARELGIPTQINTTFGHHNFDDLDALAALVEKLGIVFWEVFSLVPVGRGVVLRPLDAAEHEQLFARLYELSKRVRFVIKVTEAPHFRRYILQQRSLEGFAPDPTAPSGSAIPAQLSRDMTTSHSFGSKAKGINAGKGFVFVSHKGEVYPSGFLPLFAGNVRERPLGDIYRESKLLQDLRDPSLLEGRCGRCEFADVCGGSRARAYAKSGSMLGEDPACAYDPPPRTPDARA